MPACFKQDVDCNRLINLIAHLKGNRNFPRLRIGMSLCLMDMPTLQEKHAVRHASRLNWSRLIFHLVI